jgi:hypothetical protein
MPDKSKKKVLETFNARSSSYDNESSWVGDPCVISPLVNKPMKAGFMLDVCSGTCRVAMYGLALGWNVIASDINLDMLRKCPDSRLPRVVCDATKLPFKDRTFRLVTLRQGLHYLDILQALNELKRVSAFQVSLGHITLESPEDESWWRQYFSIASPGRKHVLPPNQVASLVELSGMKVVSQNVVYTRDRFKGPIRHLKSEEQHRLDELMRHAPAWFLDRYKVTPLGEDDYEYSHRWEFIVATV